MTREHLGIALALKIPFFVVVTKIDIAPPAVLEKTMATLLKILKSPHVKKNPQVVEDDTDISTYGDQIHDQLICPIFQVSNVTGDGLAKLTSFLSIIRSRVDVSDDFKTADDPVEFLIDGDYVVTGVGLVVAGTLNTIAGGGSFLTLPALMATSIAGLEANVANGTNRVAIVIQNIGAVWGFHRHGVVDWRYVAWAALPASFGAGLGAGAGAGRRRRGGPLVGPERHRRGEQQRNRRETEQQLGAEDAAAARELTDQPGAVVDGDEDRPLRRAGVLSGDASGRQGFSGKSFAVGVELPPVLPTCTVGSCHQVPAVHDPQDVVAV